MFLTVRGQKSPGSLLFFDLEILQGRKLVFDNWRTAIATAGVKIDSALGAEPATILTAQGPAGKSHHDLLLERFAQVEFIPFEEDQPHIVGAEFDLLTPLSLNLGQLTGEGQGEPPLKGDLERLEAATAGNLHDRLEMTFDLYETRQVEEAQTAAQRLTEVALAFPEHFFEYWQGRGLLLEVEGQALFSNFIYIYKQS